MSEQKKEFSGVCLGGFILSVSPVLLLLISRFAPAAITDILPVAFILLPLAGFIVSIAGLRYARIEGQKGKGFAIAGIALPSAGVTVVVVMLVVFFGLMGSSSTSKEIRKNEMYSMGPLSNPSNTEYDVSQYKIPQGYDFKSLNLNIGDTELKTYAETKLKKISKKTDKSMRGTWQGFNFLIVRSDRYEEWLSVNLTGYGREMYDGYTSIGYLDYWEIAATKYYPLAVYKDPSDKFVVITNCNDYKLIAEFFEGIGNAVPTEETKANPTQEGSDSEKASKEPPKFKHEKYYVMIGTMGDNNEYARLRYFDGDNIDMVVWKRSPVEFKYGDVFIPGENVSPENVVVNETDPAYPRSWFELKGDAELKLIGNCRDLFESKKLKVTGNDYDGLRHFSIHLADDKGNEYYYGFFDLGPFGVEISGAQIGDVYDCAISNGKIVIPLAGPVK